MELSKEVKQCVFAMGSLCNMLCLGMMIGFPAILVPALQAPDSDIPADKHLTSWLVSMPGFSGSILGLAVGPLMHMYGRRFANFCVVIPVLVGWIVTSQADSLPMLFLGRLLHGSVFGGANFYATCIAEFANPRIRGILLNMKLLFASIGMIVEHLLGYFLHWRHLALIGTVPCVVSLVITFYWPNTPDWLVSKGRYQEAKAVFYSLRDRNVDSEREIKKLIEEKQIQKKIIEQRSLIGGYLRKFRSKTLWRAVALQFLAFLLPELGGRLYFPAYSIELAKQLSGSKSSENTGYTYTYVIDAVNAVSTVCSFYFVKKYKRRQLLLYPTYFSVAVLIFISALLFVRSKYYDSAVMMWILLCSLAVYFFTMTCTAFAISYVIIGEVLPLKYRAAGTVISAIMASFTMVASMRIMPILRDHLQLHGMFFTYSICMLFILAYFQYDLPETKDRTLQDIANYFKGKSPKVPSENTVVVCDEIETILEK